MWNTTTKSVAPITLLLLTIAVPCTAQQLQLSDKQIDGLDQAGDRLVDQRQYEEALKKYTLAYTGVVARIRGQDFSRPVEPSILNREELGEEMRRILKREMTPEDIAELDGTLKVFGFVASDASPAKIYTNLLTEQVAGFYDPDDKRMVLIIEDAPEKEPGWLAKLLGADPFNKDEQKTTLVHELTHALQDQLYDLNAMESGIENDDDLSLAFSALVEGDATLLMFAEMQGEVDISEMDPDAMRRLFNIMNWLMPLSAGESYRKAPAIFRETLMFPYFQGMLFVMSQGTKKGWPGVAEFYKSPPLSTEQILHPQKYAPGKDYDAPTKVTLPELGGLVGKKWYSLGGSCLGELQTRILLGKVPGGKDASLGWDGDHYEVFMRTQDAQDRFALAWVSIWDSAGDAQEFAKCYRIYRGVGSEQRDSSGPTPTWLHSGEGVFGRGATCQVKVDGAQCFIVDGFRPKAGKTIMRKLQESKFTEKTFPPPAKKTEPEAVKE